MQKYKRVTIIVLILVSFYAVTAAGCLLGDDIATLREKAGGGEGGNSGKADNSGTVPGSTLTAKLSWLESNAQSGGNYIVEVSSNENIGPATLSYSGKTNITIILKGVDANRVVSLSSNGAMFTVENGVTLVLDNNITLQGRSNNAAEFVRVNEGGMLVMNAGSRITGNTNTSGIGGVYVSRGTFTMNGGTISGNTGSNYGGGVYVNYSGIFTMNNGTISGNTAVIGGGVASVTGTFTMNGGTISGNIAYASASASEGSYGGGVHITGGTFIKTGGTIYGYSASDTANSNTVKNSSGAVLNNHGHAVYVSSTTRRETTAGPNVNMDSATAGTAGGWEN